MTPLYIFDLDGTLALIEHRRHLVEKRACPACHGTCIQKRTPVEVAGVLDDGAAIPVYDACQACGGLGRVKPDWPAFFAACVDDQPNWPVISAMNAVLKSGADVQIWSGRSAEVMNESRTWIQKWCSRDDLDLEDVGLVMRREGDFTPDEQLKEGWLQAMTEFNRRRLVAVFDDRQKVVDMWRRNGVACFQVAPGDF